MVEAFAAETRMKSATVTLVPNNASAFVALKNGVADVTFAVSIEAHWHHTQHEGFCAVHLDQPYTQVEKVFLFAKDQATLRDSFNRWLALFRGPPQ